MKILVPPVMEGYNTYMIGVASEIGILQKVLLHRPGSEFERLTPKYLEEMLFEDIPYLKKIREEHDKFAETLCSLGCEVYYYQDLLMEVLRTEEFRDGNSRSRP